MNLDLEPGDFVINPLNKSWGNRADTINNKK